MSVSALTDDTLQAAVLLSKFSLFPGEIELRQQVAHKYADLLGGLEKITVPQAPVDVKSVYAQYSLLAGDAGHREQILGALRQAAIPTGVYYPKPLHLQTAFAYLEYHAGDFPVSEDAARRIFSLPMHPYLETADQEKIAQIIAAI